MTPGRAASTPRGFTAIAVVVAAWVAAFLYYRAHWTTIEAFVAFLDHCPTLFCDFEEVFRPQGAILLPEGRLAEGYFYSAPFALLLSGLRYLPEASATQVWGLFELITTVGLFTIPLLPRADGPRPVWRVAAYALAFTLSTPVLHNAKWGQVSALIVLLVLFAIRLEERGRAARAGAVLAIAIAIKYYPVVFLAHFVIRRNWRALAASLGTLALIALATLAVLGLEATLAFQAGASAALSDARWNLVPFEPNSQYFVHVFNRLWEGGLPGPDRFWTYSGYAFVAVLLAGLWFLQQAGANVGRWTPILLLTTTPIWVPTSWPHYLIFLPFVQLAVLDDLLTEPSRRWRVAGGVLLAISLAAGSSLLLLEYIGEWGTYSYRGYLLLADGCLLAYALNALRRDAWPALREARRR